MPHAHKMWGGGVSVPRGCNSTPLFFTFAVSRFKALKCWPPEERDARAATFFEKTLDKLLLVWYNNDSEREVILCIVENVEMIITK